MRKNYIGKIFSFDNFDVNENNSKAFESMLNIYKKDEKVYNPSYLCGPNGSGKTHILKAIIDKYPDLICKYVFLDEIVYEFTKNLRNQTMDKFRGTYRTLDVLCIDNFEYIEGKEATQEEMVNIFSNLINNNKIIILASTKNLNEIKLSDKLKALIEYGQNIEIKVY